MVPNDAAVAQLRRGVLEHCVLALLEGEERYGYDLVTELSSAGLLASEGTMYPLLSRLRKEDLVATTWQDSPNGPPRRYYSLTPGGKEAVASFRDSWTQFKSSVDTILEGRKS
jgi:PadR family transcriptional regulator, regulatory protein PadR